MKTIVLPSVSLFNKSLMLWRWRQAARPLSIAKLTSADLRRDLDLTDITLYRVAPRSHIPYERRPLVLLYSWLGGRPRHIRKYIDLYHERGVDVLNVRLLPTAIAWPLPVTAPGGVVEQVLDFADTRTAAGQPLLVHGLSVGGYLYAQTVFKLIESAHKYGRLVSRLRGQVFDSPVDTEGTAVGISRALVPRDQRLQRLVQRCLEGYLHYGYHLSTRYLNRCSFIFHQNLLRVPTLMLYSTADRVAAYQRVELACRRWMQDGVPTYYRRWCDSEHVQHLPLHPDEYRQTVDMFIDRIGVYAHANDVPAIVAKNSAEYVPGDHRIVPESVPGDVKQVNMADILKERASGLYNGSGADKDAKRRSVEHTKSVDKLNSSKNATSLTDDINNDKTHNVNNKHLRQTSAIIS